MLRAREAADGELERARSRFEDSGTALAGTRGKLTDGSLPDCCIEYANQCCSPAELAPRMNRLKDETCHLDYYKYLEIAMTTDLPRDAQRSAHLCEAPGSFIDACMDIHGAKLDWHAITRRGWAFHRRHLVAKRPNFRNRVSVGEDGSGDLLVHANLSRFCQDVGHSTVDLVTADASAEAPSPERILASELAIALTLLRASGCLVIRVNLTRREPLIRMLITCTRAFHASVLMRPEAARVRSDEMYLVCKGFRADVGPRFIKKLTSVAFDDATAAEPADATTTIDPEHAPTTGELVDWYTACDLAHRSIGARIDRAVALAAFFKSIDLDSAEAITHHIRTYLIDNARARQITREYLDRISFAATAPP